MVRGFALNDWQYGVIINDD